MPLIFNTSKLSADAFIDAVKSQAREMNQEDNEIDLWIKPFGFWEATWGLHESVTIEQQRDGTWLHSFEVIIRHPVQEDKDAWDSEDARIHSGWLPIEVRTDSTNRTAHDIWVKVNYDPSREHPDVLPYAVDLFRKVDAITENTYDQLVTQSEPIRRVILGHEEPWELIDGPPAHKHAVRLWWSGLEHEEIGNYEEVSMAKGSVTVLLSKLRKKYGNDIVPTIDGLKDRGIR